MFEDPIFNKIVNEVADKYNITVTGITSDHIEANGIGGYINRSYVTGGTKIKLGLYSDEELKAISFFHELGHILTPDSYIESVNYNTFLIELEAWNIGLKIAIEHNLNFTDNAIAWGYEQALSYENHDEREKVTYQFKRLLK